MCKLLKSFFAKTLILSYQKLQKCYGIDNEVNVDFKDKVAIANNFSVPDKIPNGQRLLL